MNDFLTFTRHPDTGGVVLKVREATKKGYSLAYPYDSINIGVPNSQRRGRVGRGVVDTLTTGNDKAVFVLD